MTSWKKEILDQVKVDFCDLVSSEDRADSLEIFTPFCTITNKFVSVFVTLRREGFVVSDGGWISQGLYDTNTSGEVTEIEDRVLKQFLSHHQIKTIKASDSTVYYYKTTRDRKLITSLVFNVGQFICSAVNNASVSYLDSKGESDRARFSTNVRSYFKERYSSTDFDKPAGKDDLLKDFKFNAIINKPSKSHLFMLISGSDPGYFKRDISQAIVNFDQVLKTPNSNHYNRIALINSQATGYVKEKVNSYLNLLSDRLDQPIIDFWANPEVIESIIPIDKPKMTA